jgi:hypothetical protein
LQFLDEDVYRGPFSGRRLNSWRKTCLEVAIVAPC